MDDLRDSVRHAQYEQKDPLLIYKLESKTLFNNMLTKVNKDIISFLMRAKVQGLQEASLPAPVREQPAPKLQTSRTELPEFSAPNASQQGEPQRPEQPKAQPIVREEKKVGRNDKVLLYNVMTNEKKEVKFKLAEPMIKSGQWRVLDEANV
jgi:preprotein translocase subunit SecA